MVKEHLNSPLPEGKTTKKVLVLGYDGARAELLANVRPSGVLDKDGNDIYSGDNPPSHFSAVNYVIDNMGGKAYLAYAGGDVKDNFQATSTAPGWAAITTGAWGKVNGVPDNPDEEKGTNIKNLNKKTFMLEAAEQGKRSIMLASWDAHKTTYKSEMDFVKEKGLPMEFYGFGEYGYTIELDENGEPVLDDEGEEKKIKLNDHDVHNKILSCVTEGSVDEKDVIFGIYDWTDHNGHGTGFTNENRNYVNSFRYSNNMIYEVIQKIISRTSYNTEDWLIILTADHGGIKTWHGEQNPECRTTFIVTNKTGLVKSEYYGKNYDGFKENK